MNVGEYNARVHSQSHKFNVDMALNVDEYDTTVQSQSPDGAMTLNVDGCKQRLHSQSPDVAMPLNVAEYNTRVHNQSPDVAAAMNLAELTYNMNKFSHQKSPRGETGCTCHRGNKKARTLFKSLPRIPFLRYTPCF